jgi:cytochrome c5
MALFVLLHRVIRIALQRYCECEPRSILVRRDVLFALALVFLVYPASSNSVRGEQSAHEVSVYSEEQATRGRGLYAEHCASCHGVKLEGASSMPLSGATFEERWADEKHSVDDLFYIVRTLMPYGRPATLSKGSSIRVLHSSLEHPELIAQRIARYANLVGRDNVIAGSDCGFGTWVGQAAVDPDVVWAKLAAMAEGARLATKQFWGD